MSVLFRAASYLDDDFALVRGRDILVVGAHIAAIGEGLAAPDGAQIVEARGLLLVPGFVNAHTHSPEALARGRAPMARLDAWLADAWRGLDALDEAGIEAAIDACAQEMIREGCVAVLDHFRQTPQTAWGLRAARRAWARSGLDVTLAIMLRDKPTSSGASPGDPAKSLALLDAALAIGDGVRIAVAASAPDRASPEFLNALVGRARAAKAPLHMHVCETAEDAAACRAAFGGSAIAHLERLGALGERTSLAHCVHLDTDDPARLAATGTTLVHNPIANLRLGSGIAPIRAALDAGVALAVGTDGAASNDSQSMHEAIKHACLLSRVAGSRDNWISPREALAAGIGGGASFGVPRARIAAGARADIACFASDAASLEPLHDPVAQIVFAAARGDVVHTMAKGRFLLRDRAPKRLVGAEAA
jgi:5-methylthioadenosine/S-adenosylhomocysteine deaminase